MSVGLFLSFRTEMSGGDDGKIKLNVCPIGMDGSVVSFYVKKTTALRKIKNSYGEKNGIEVHTLRFCFEGVRIGDTDTAENLQLKEGDTIEVFPELVGNCPGTCPGNMRFTIHFWVFYVFICRLSRNGEVADQVQCQAGAGRKNNSEYIKLSVEGEVSFRVKKTMPLEKLKKKYSERIGVSVHTLMFCFEGHRIHDDDTAENLELEEGDTIEVIEMENMRLTIG